MKTASAPLIAALNGGQSFLIADLYTFTLVNTVVARYAVSDTDLTFGGNLFSATTVNITRGKIKTVIGVQVDTLDITISARIEHLLNGTPFLTACQQGALDGARVKVERVFMPTPGDTTTYGSILLFTGRVASMDFGRSQVQMTVNSDLELLNVKLPRNLFQPGCINTLYDGGCTLVQATFGTASTVLTGGDNDTILCGLAQANDYFTHGTIKMTSGALNGVTATIKQYTVGHIELLVPMIAAPAIGDTFTAYAGCDKQKNTCNSKFANLLHFRGSPYIPTPENVL
jgi:uncharacterized phage protein (TIGR02218 family)